MKRKRKYSKWMNRAFFVAALVAPVTAWADEPVVTAPSSEEQPLEVESIEPETPSETPEPQQASLETSSTEDPGTAQAEAQRQRPAQRPARRQGEYYSGGRIGLLENRFGGMTGPSLERTAGTVSFNIGRIEMIGAEDMVFDASASAVQIGVAVDSEGNSPAYGGLLSEFQFRASGRFRDREFLSRNCTPLLGFAANAEGVGFNMPSPSRAQVIDARFTTGFICTDGNYAFLVNAESGIGAAIDVRDVGRDRDEAGMITGVHARFMSPEVRAVLDVAHLYLLDHTQLTQLDARIMAPIAQLTQGLSIDVGAMLQVSDRSGTPEHDRETGFSAQLAAGLYLDPSRPMFEPLPEDDTSSGAAR